MLGPAPACHSIPSWACRRPDPAGRPPPPPRCSDVRNPFGADPQKNPQALREQSPPDLFEKDYTSAYTKDALANVNDSPPARICATIRMRAYDLTPHAGARISHGYRSAARCLPERGEYGSPYKWKTRPEPHARGGKARDAERGQCQPNTSPERPQAVRAKAPSKINSLRKLQMLIHVNST